MIYLGIGLVVGIALDRYALPIFDMLLEMLQYKITQTCTIIQVNTNLVSLEYEQLINKNNELTPAIGFITGQQENDILEEEQEDDENKMRIGFIGKR